jgi:hypothetical protein
MALFPIENLIPAYEPHPFSHSQKQSRSPPEKHETQHRIQENGGFHDAWKIAIEKIKRDD